MVYPKVENDISLRAQLSKLPQLSKEPSPDELKALFVEMSDILSRMSPDASRGQQEKLLMLVSKIHPQQWKDMRDDERNRDKRSTFDSLKEFWRKKVIDDSLERFLYPQAKAFGGEKSANIHLIGESEEPSSTNPGKGKSKGKGKGKGFNQHKPSGRGPPADCSNEPNFKAKITCKYCKRVGHYEDACWTKNVRTRSV